MTFVPLDRQFVFWNEKDGDTIDPQRFVARSWETKGWGDLLSNHRVVVLSEAGSGKSDELAEQERLIRSEGKRAFLFSVQGVGHDGLPGVLSAHDRAAFEAWKASTEPAWLFIDSVDEAKLDGLRLETALRKIADGVFGFEDRVHIILSGRFTDWEFEADLTRFNAALAMPARASAESTPLAYADLLAALRNETRAKKAKRQSEQTVVVLMAPLDKDRVRAFARARQVPYLEAFIAAIETQNLWDLARRPLDLIWLVDFWTSNLRFGTFSQMLEASISERLKETNAAYIRTDQIAPQQAMAFVERIGATFVFGQKDHLATPDASANSRVAKDAFNLEDITPDLAPQHRQRLLLRPVFDPATFDRIRFHNDNEGKVRSYLAARWLRKRRASNGCSQQELFDLLFSETYGIKTIIPSAQQTAAWLSVWDEEVAREVIARDPYLLLSSGDPASLPLGVRQDALRGVAKQMLNPDWQFRLFDHDSLRRLSTPDMVPVISELFASSSHNTNLRHLLLGMIGLGALHQCSAAARAATFDATGDSTTRVFGARAFLKFATPDDLIDFAKYIESNAPSLPGTMLWESLDLLFPSRVSVNALIAVVDSLPEETRDETLGFSYYGPKLVQRIQTIDDLERLIDWLFVKIGVVSDNYAQDTKEERAYRPALEEAALALLRVVNVHSAPTPAIDVALRLGSNRFYGGNKTEIERLTMELHRTSARKRAAFWRAADYLNGNKILQGKPLSSIQQMQILGWTPGIAQTDLEWLLNDIKEQPTANLRALAAHAVLDLWSRSDRDTGILDKLKSACTGIDDLDKHIDAWENPPPRSSAEKARQSENTKLRAKYDAEQAKHDQSWIKFVEDIKANPESLRNLPMLGNDRVDPRLFYLWELLSSQSSHMSRYAIDDVSVMVPIVGKEVADALTDALIAFWRQRDPILVSERNPDNRNTIQKFDCMAITGVTLEAKRDPGWADKLISEEATKVVRFATLELNGFPCWILELCASWPAEASSVLMGEVISQLDDPEDQPHGVIDDISYAPVVVATTVASEILTEIEKRPGLGPKILSPALNAVVIGADDTTKARLARLALDRFAAADPNDETTATYLAAALRVDPTGAIAAITAKLDTLDPRAQTHLVMMVLPRIFGGWAMRDDGPQAVLPVDVLERLIILAFGAVKFDEDIVRPSGKVFSPNFRDEAERARAGAFSRLLDIPGRAAFAVLERLSQTPGFAVPPARMRQFMARRAALDSEHAPWKAGEAEALERAFDTAPQTPLDLQRVAMRRISDIEHALHHSDFAQGVTLKRLQNEREVQVWIANELRNRKGRAYTGEREPHVVEEKEPDIRLQASGSNASLPIEIKVAESWSIPDLEKALKVQLGGRYLRAKDAKHGILLLVHKEPHTWSRPGGEKWKLADVVKHLRAVADATASSGPTEPQATIAVIDVTDVIIPVEVRRTRAAKARSARGSPRLKTQSEA